MVKSDVSEVSIEAVWALSNCTQSANPEQITNLVGKDILSALSSSLESTDVRSLMVALTGLNNILGMGRD